MREGWKCPVCNRGLSPNVQHCDHVGVNPVTQFPAWPPDYPYPSPGVGIGISPALSGGSLSTPESMRNRAVYFSRDLQLPSSGMN